jgi:predicted RNA-binding protein YlxR (DUF448 family)
VATKAPEESPNPSAVPPRRGRFAAERDCVPLRRCIVSHRTLPKAALIRFVIGPENQAVPDIEGNLPGRGLWLCAEPNMIETACVKGLFARAARRQVVADRDLADKVESGLARRALDFLGLAQRAGQAVAGHEGVRRLIAGGGMAVLVQARDGAAEGRARLRACVPELPTVEFFSSAELSRALGRERVVHAGLRHGRLAERFLAECRRLEGFRPVGDSRLPLPAWVA